MKIICDSAELSRAMATVTRALPQKAVMPVLDGVCICAHTNSVTLSCTDLKMGISCEIPAQVDSTGSAVLQGKLFAEIARRLPQGNVTLKFTLEGEDSGAVLTAPGLRTRLFIMDASEFPALSDVDSPQSIKLSATVLRSLIRQSVFAAAVEEGSRPILTGALLEISSGKCRLVALDGYRLAYAEAPYEGEVAGISAVIPALALNKLASVIDENDSINIELGKSHLRVISAGTRFVTRLLEGDFIRYEQIMPKDWSTRLIIDRDSMSDALDRAAMLARDGSNNLVKLHLKSTSSTITSNNDQGDIFEELSGAVEGNELEIAFNARYLIDIFRNIQSGNVVMDFTSPVAPCIMHPENGTSRYLVLPVRIYG